MIAAGGIADRMASMWSGLCAAGRREVAAADPGAASRGSSGLAALGSASDIPDMNMR